MSTHVTSAHPDPVAASTHPVSTGTAADHVSTGTAPANTAPAHPASVRPAPPAEPRYADYREPIPFARGPFAAQTWREFGFLTVTFFLSTLSFSYAVFAVSMGLGLAVLVVGIFVFAALLLSFRWWNATFRALARGLGDLDIQPPAPLAASGGAWNWVKCAFLDGSSWRTLVYCVVVFPVSMFGWIVSLTVGATGLGALTHGLWAWALPAQQAPDGTWHKGANFGNNYFIDTPPRLAAMALVGLVLCFAWPYVNRACTQLVKWLSIALLAPSDGALRAAEQRVAELERSRANTVVGADARLRQIERDLHDGTQARLVAVAMQLGEMKEQMATGDQPDGLQPLVNEAHASVKDAITELREITRSIHPPALDRGLAVALETLAARSAVPVRLTVGDLGALPAPVESVAYFTVAELVTNTAKHAGATSVAVSAYTGDGVLHLQVSDDGCGGAQITHPGSGGGTGLAGLDERIGAVDGLLHIDSPAGGPTVITVDLPVALAGGQSGDNQVDAATGR